MPFRAPETTGEILHVLLTTPKQQREARTVEKKTLPVTDIRPPYIRERQVESRFGVSRGTQYRLRMRGIFPRGIRVSPRTVIYSEPEIIDALAILSADAKR